MASTPQWASVGSWSTSATYGGEPQAPPESLTATFYMAGGAVGANLLTGNACQDMRPNPTRYRVAEGLAYGRCYPTVPAKAFYWTPEDLIINTRPATVQPSHWSQYNGCSGYGSVRCSELPTLPSITSVETALRTLFDSADGALQRAFWEWVISKLPPPSDPVWQNPDYQPPVLDPTEDGGPMGRVRVPTGIGTPKADYISRLHANDLQAQVEDSHDFNREHDPDDVLYVNPSQETWTDRGSSVQIVVNPTTITVPSPSPSETATEYAARASKYGLNPHLEYDTAPDPSKPTDAIAGTPLPAPGTQTQPRQQLGVPAVNPPTDDEHDPRCRVPQGSLPDPDAAFDARDRLDEESVIHTFPHAFSEPGGELVLRVGQLYGLSYGSTNDVTGWGYVKIKAKHGWGAAEVAKTQAVVSEVAPTQQPNGRYLYRQQFSSATDHDCDWHVVVDRDPVNPIHPEDGPYGIWTAFGKLR